MLFRSASVLTKKTRAFIAVNLYGQPVDYSELNEVATDLNLKFIIDEAQSHGARKRGSKSSEFADISCFSFYPGKNLGALGDGGAITTDSNELAHKVRVLRNYGSQEKYKNEVLGYNNRLDELQAAFLRVKLSKLDKWTEERNTIAEAYRNELIDIPGIELFNLANGATSAYHLFVVKTKNRKDLQSKLSEAGVGTLIHYPIPPHLQECYRHLGYNHGDLPIAENLAQEVLSLPLFLGMNEGQISNVVKTVFENW